MFYGKLHPSQILSSSSGNLTQLQEAKIHNIWDNMLEKQIEGSILDFLIVIRD